MSFEKADHPPSEENQRLTASEAKRKLHQLIREAETVDAHRQDTLTIFDGLNALADELFKAHQKKITRPPQSPEEEQELTERMDRLTKVFNHLADLREDLHLDVAKLRQIEDEITQVIEESGLDE